MRILGLIILHVFISLQVCFAQSKTITGRVTDETNATGMPGVSVSLKGAKTGTTTDPEGRFSINAPANGTLVFSFIGYGSKELPVNGQSVVDVTMTTENSALNEVVVVGYGKEKKVN